MLEKPKNYEEAKKILIDGTKSDYNKNSLNVFRLRAGLIAVGGTIVAMAAGLITQQPAATLAILPNAILLGGLNYLPLFYRKKMMKDIQDGKYFEQNSEDTVMKDANMYVDGYNTFLEENRGRSR